MPFVTIKPEEIGKKGPLSDGDTMIKTTGGEFPDGVINWASFMERRRSYQVNGNLFQTPTSAVKHVMACGFSGEEAVAFIKSLRHLNKVD